MSVEKLIVDHMETWTSALQTRSTAGRGSSGKIDLYGIKKLRELILELAVRGKLVPQDPNDEPASELLKRIAAEKAELVKQGKIKKQKPLPGISEEEKPFELPVGWEWVRLGNIAEYIQRGKGPKYSENGTVRVVSQKCVQWSGFKLEQSRWITDESIPSYTEERFLKNGDVLWNSTGAGGTAGRVNFLETVKERLVVDSHVTIIRSIKQNGQFICNYISTYGIQQLFDPKHPKTLLSGTTNQAELNTSVVISFITPFPPQKEQERINTKVIELMSLCDRLEQESLISLDAHQQLVETLLGTLTDSQNAGELAENWARISEHFDTLFTTEASVDALKQTILQLAVMGKLVPQDPNDEPASELLKRIEQEKAQLVKEGKIKKQKLLPPISDEEKPFELPEGWEWCRLGNILQDIKYGTSQKCNYNIKGVPVLRIPNIVKGFIELDDIKYGELTDAELEDLKLKKNDLLIIRSNGSTNIVGKSTLVESNLNNYAYAGYIIRVRLHNNFIHAHYINAIMSSCLVRSQIEGPIRTTTGVKNINSNELMGLLIPLPPLNQQITIIDKLDETHRFISKLKNLTQSAQQTQLHLADALTDAAIN
ncbi:restriction endonuclease subunit S [Escherichia coli]|uniref:restriction endonuclease subunit S n=1 Tax=Escherichia coli TaxID=562 RepID=UPI0012FF9D2C|nr:restriction endonuclease subunit S [Escherichia coli]MBB7851701.1 restriction endonuclease subunit S [Escherichia coli]